MGTDYEAIWLRKCELDEIFTREGVDGRAFLHRALQDRGIVTTRAADPAVDLFRLPQPLAGGFAARWKPNADNVDWEGFGIRAPVSGRHGVFDYDPTPIEVSAELLKELLSGKPPQVPAGKVQCSIEAYRDHWNEVKPWPSGEEDDLWAKQNNYSVESVRGRRTEHIANLPADLREHIQKGGRRRPFKEPGGNL